MKQYADCCQFTGTVLVSEHDRLIFQKGYGMANREWNIANTPDVKFRIGSITKQFASLLIMQQVAKGTIKLDGNVYDSLAEAYAKNGQKQLAIESYHKSIELDPKNQNAVDKLKELEKN